MNKVKFVLLACLATFLLPAVAQQMPQLPMDPAVRYGKLANGLTYYIRHNAEPKGQANFYIAQKVGSVQEEESQRGLAHFLEHMAFNGSKHFPNDGQLVKYCESIGVKFGQNLNAYTSTDETVYNIDNVPVTGANVDSCIYILADWSGGLHLTTKEIDKERGVIHEEWRQRSSGAMRIYERQLGKLYPGSKYADRMPIGIMEVVDNFHPDTLRAYYRKWYRPDLQGIVIVGDINVDEVEGKVKSILGQVEMPKNPAKYEHYPVPDTPQPIYIIDTDKELAQSDIHLMFKQDPFPEALRNTPMAFAQKYVLHVIESAINERLEELATKETCPFKSAGVGYGNYLLSKTKDAFSVSIAPKQGRDKEAVQLVMQEVERAMRFGITGTEIFRAKEEFLNSMEAIYNNRDKQKHNFYTRQYVRHFLESEAITDIETEFNTYKMLAEQIPAEMINETLKPLAASTDTNFVCFAMYPEKEGWAVPTVDDIKTSIAAAKAAKLEAFVDNVKNEPLVAKLPKKGSIKKEAEAGFGYKVWTLSNGARVFFKQTDFNQSQVLFAANSWGGSNKFADKDVANSKLISAAISSLGLGNFTANELSKKLAGKQASVEAVVGKNTEGLSGSSTPKDLRTLFELIYLKFQAPGNDVDSYNTLIANLKTSLVNAAKLPQTAFRDSMISTLFHNHIRRAPISLADVEKADLATIKRLYRERFNAAGDFDFYFTGAFNVDSLRQFTEQYIASLPKVKKREVASNIEVDPVRGIVENRFVREMETPQAQLIQVWNGKHKYSMKDAIAASVLGDVLDKRYLKSIREEGGMAYSVSASGSVDYDIVDTYSLQIYCPFTPEKVDSVLYLMDEGLKEVAKTGVNDDELDEIRKFELKQFGESQRNNSYWQRLITNQVMWGKDNYTGYEAAIKSVNSEDVKRFLNDVILRDKNRATIIMLPKVAAK